MPKQSIRIEDAEQAELALHRLGTLKRERDQLRAATDQTIADAREQLREADHPLDLERRRLESALKRFAKSQQHAWKADGRSSATFTHGRIGFRKKPERLELPKDEVQLLSRMDELGLDHCIRSYRAPDREQLKLEADATLEVLGIKRKGGETFYVDPRAIDPRELDGQDGAS